MNAEGHKFVDRTGKVREAPSLIPPVVIKRKDIDADAKRTDLRGELIDPTIDSGAVQAKGQRETADAAADDDDVQIASCSASSCMSRGSRRSRGDAA